MDCGVLSWRDTALRKMRIKGVKGLQVELLVAYRGHPVETAVWGKWRWPLVGGVVWASGVLLSCTCMRMDRHTADPGGLLATIAVAGARETFESPHHFHHAHPTRHRREGGDRH